MNNIEKLQSLLCSIADCALITNDINRRYFTGMKSSAGTVLVFADTAYLIIDFRYIEKARASVTACEVIQQDKLYEQISELIKKHGAETCAIESRSMTVSELESVKKKLACEVVGSDALSDAIANLRMIKTPDEVEKVKAAQSIAEKGFEHMLEYIQVGRTERELQLELDYFMLRNGAEALSFDTIALSGKNTSMPHGVPGDKRVERGDFVLLDYGAVVDGYHSDMTRTVAVGEPTDEMKEVYELVLAAQKNAIEKVKAGMTGSEYDAIARELISSHGYGDNFQHSLGHGVGLEIHEAPNGSPSYNGLLPAGAVITCEPGIYIAGRFGVRIEDMIYITENGAENLTHSPKELIVL